jgi:hypothetical protein
MNGSPQTASILALTLALAASFAAASARAEDEAQAAHDSRLEMAFGSTIVSTYPDGRQAELWLKRDGSYDMEGRRHDRSSGTWQIKDDDKHGKKLCFKQHHPFPVPFSYCTPAPEAIDKPWTAKAVTGEPISVRLVHGIVDPAKGQTEGDRNAQAGRQGGNG